MQSTGSSSQIELLLVEDNPGDIELIKLGLAQATIPYQITVKTDGQAAIEYLQAAKALPDLVILDINLPKKTGHEVLSEIRSDSQMRHLPVLVLTGSRSHSDFRSAYQMQANACLRKPDSVSEMFELTKSIEVFWLHWVVLLRPQLLELQSQERSMRQSILLAERSAQEAQILLAAIVESSRDAIIASDLTGIVTAWNHGATAMYGYMPEEIVGGSIRVLIPEERLSAEMQALERIRLGETVHPYETIRRTKDGRLLAISLSLSPMRDADGAIVGASRIARDISHQIESEARLKSANDELSRLTEDYQKLVERLNAIREEERSRLARELHDQMGQSLTLIKQRGYLIERAVSEEKYGSVVELAQASVAAANDLMQLVRNIASELRPPILDLVGLAGALKWQAELIRTQSAVDVSVDVPIEEPNVTELERINLFRITQEALTNAVRHSRAEHIAVSLLDDAESLRLTISDSGIGIQDVEHFQHSHGVLGMRERARLLGASLEIIRSPDHGTTVIVTLNRSTKVPNDDAKRAAG